jgi:DNA-binding YbaB/EbfC family protein
MFDALKNLGGLGNIAQLMAKAKEAKEKLAAMQEELARKTVTADAGGGLVEATCNGRLELVRIRVNRARLGVANADTGKTQLGDDDVELLEDLIVAAVAAAQAKAKQLAADEMSKLGSDLGLPPGALPGM